MLNELSAQKRQKVLTLRDGGSCRPQIKEGGRVIMSYMTLSTQPTSADTKRAPKKEGSSGKWEGISERVNCDLRTLDNEKGHRGQSPP